MGCFPACFGHLRQNVTTKKVQDQCSSPSNEHHESAKLLPDKTESEEEIVNPIKLISQFEDISNEEETVSVHSNVIKGTTNNEPASSNTDHFLETENGKVEEEREKDKEDTESDSKNSLNHQDFLLNDKECLAKESSPVPEESCCSSLFSLSIDSRKHVFAAEMGEKEVSSLLKMKKTTSFMDQDEEKENLHLSKDPMTEKSKSEMAVETSLSSWLVESEKSPKKLSVVSSPESENNYGDRQILGAIASPCCSTDDQPGVGTVGRYWRRRGGAGEEVAADREVSTVSVEAS